VIPSVVTHYHLARRPPFLNLSDLDDDGLAAVLAELDAERTSGVCGRVFGRRYMDLRRRTEEKLRALFIDAGGRPERRAPHYFVLGTSRWYEGLSVEMEAVVLPLADLPTDVTSVTACDSFTAMALGPDYGLPLEPRPYHETVFRLEELPGLIATYGFPADDAPDSPDAGDADVDRSGDYEGYEKRPFEKFVEVQLWSDRPLEGVIQERAVQWGQSGQSGVVERGRS
jgi:hypothetical protein